jgi:D-alanine-D-alanine ligase
MKRSLAIGIVYNLREEYLALGYSEEETAEFDTIASLEAMVGGLERLGHNVDRIGDGRALAGRLVRGDVWDLVLPMAEGLSGRSREAQVPALLELFNQPYAFSDPLTMAIALDKSVAKRLIRDAGVPTAESMLVETGREDFTKWQHYPAFVKPVAEGTSKGCGPDSLVEDSDHLAKTALSLMRHFRQPVLVETYLPGREFTVGIIGNDDQIRVLGVAEITMNAGADPDIFSMRNKEDQESLCTFSGVDDAEAKTAASGLIPTFGAPA